MLTRTQSPNKPSIGNKREHRSPAASGTADAITTLTKADALVDIRGEIGHTPLHLAAAEGTPENLVALLKAGANVNIRGEGGDTPLHLAAETGAQENIRLLLSAGADTTLLGCEDKTALELAKENPKVKGSEAYWLLNDALYD